MSAVDQLTKALEETWAHPEESVSAALEGVRPEEAEWQPPAYGREQPMPEMPLPGTICWQVAHLAHSGRHYAEILRRRPVSEHPRTAPPQGSGLEELRAHMADAYANLHSEIARLSEKNLGEPCMLSTMTGEFVRMVIRHYSWHAGQIVVVRRLYRTAQDA